MLARLQERCPGAQLVRVGVEAAGHYHRPLTMAGVWPGDWQLVELNPAHVSAQRRVNGQRGVKTDRVDLVAIADLLLAGRGCPVAVCGESLIELSAWVAHRRRRGEVRTATENQLLTQLDRAFPGLGLALADVLGTKVGPRVAAHFADPARLARLRPTGSASSPPAAACGSPARSPRGWCRRRAWRCPPPRRRSPGRSWPSISLCWPSSTGPGRRSRTTARDCASGQPVQRADQRPRLGRRAPSAAYGAAVGDPAPRWPGPAQLYPRRRAELGAVRVRRQTPRRGDQPRRQRRAAPGADRARHRPLAQRPGRPALRQPRLRARGKHGGVISCALAHRANRIAFALVRDQTSYDPTRWS